MEIKRRYLCDDCKHNIRTREDSFGNLNCRCTKCTCEVNLDKVRTCRYYKFSRKRNGNLKNQ